MWMSSEIRLSHCQQALEAPMKTPYAKATGQYHYAVAGGSMFITYAFGNRETHPQPRGGTDLLPSH